MHDVRARITAWLAEADLDAKPPEKLAEGHEFALVFRYPRRSNHTVQLVRLKGKSFVGLAMATEVAPSQVEALKAGPPELRAKVVAVLRRVAFQGGVVGYRPVLDGDALRRWILDVSVYDDGLTQHELHRQLRALLTKHLEMLDAFHDLVRTRTRKREERPADTTDLPGYL